MITFNYTNSHGEEATYTGIPLDSSLYEQILLDDKGFLEEIATGNSSSFSSEEYVKAAKDMLISYGKGKQSTLTKNSDITNEIYFIQNKIVIKESSETKKSLQTPKAIIRKSLRSNSIRMFKKDKINLVLA